MRQQVPEVEFIALRPSQVHYFEEVPLYHRTDDATFILYKESGARLPPQRAISDRYPQLYMRQCDRRAALTEAQQIYKNKFVKGVHRRDTAYVKTIFAELVTDLFCEARIGAMKGMFEAARDGIELLLQSYAKETIHLSQPVSQLDYGTALHSVNVMAISIAFCRHQQVDDTTAADLGLCGLLHDIGKTKISLEILFADRKLTDQEFAVVKQHPLDSEAILTRGGLSAPVRQGALEHHEKLNGHGYPRHTSELSFFGRLIGFVDCYEALTCDDRPYRRRLAPFDALRLIREEMEQGCFDREIYREFVACLLRPS